MDTCNTLKRLACFTQANPIGKREEGGEGEKSMSHVSVHLVGQVGETGRTGRRWLTPGDVTAAVILTPRGSPALWTHTPTGWRVTLSAGPLAVAAAGSDVCGAVAESL